MAAASRRSTRRRPGGRSARIRRAIMQATLKELASKGYDALTLDGIAERAGCGRATLYRHWEAKSDLVADTLSANFGKQIEREVDHGNVRADLLELMQELSRVGSSPLGRGLALSLASATSRDVARLALALNERMVASWSRCVERAIERGELPARVNPREVVSLLCDVLVHRTCFKRNGVVATGELRRLIEVTLRGAESLALAKKVERGRGGKPA